MGRTAWVQAIRHSLGLASSSARGCLTPCLSGMLATPCTSWLGPGRPCRSCLVSSSSRFVWLEQPEGCDCVCSFDLRDGLRGLVRIIDGGCHITRLTTGESPLLRQSPVLRPNPFRVMTSNEPGAVLRIGSFKSGGRVSLYPPAEQRLGRDRSPYPALTFVVS